MVDLSPKSEISFFQMFLCSAFTTCFAEFCTILLDTAKVRLQLQKKAVVGDAADAPKYRGLLGTMATIAREEGLAAPWNSIIPGLQRQCIYGGLRISALAIIVANPTDLVKVQLQAEGKLPGGVPRHYSGAKDNYFTIARQEGLGALWTGLGPNVARNAIINAAELGSYDQVEEVLTEGKQKDVLKAAAALFSHICEV